MTSRSDFKSWAGGGMPPVSGYTLVDVEMRGGWKFDGKPAMSHDWRHADDPSDIIAWRPHRDSETFDRLSSDGSLSSRKAEENKLECGRDDYWKAEQMEWPDDMVNHPPHYTSGGIECIEAIEAAVEHLDGFEAYCTGNAIKYLWRWKLKGGKQDIEKAIWYLNRLVDGD